MSTQPQDEDAIAEHLPPVPRLVFNGIALVPYDKDPLHVPNALSHWCMPGGSVLSTEKILRRAKQENVSLILILN